MRTRSLITLSLLAGAIAVLAWKLCFVAAPASPPKLGVDWHEQTYGLDPGESARFVPPPYSPGRMQDLGRGWAGAPPKNVTGQLIYHALPARTLQWGMSSAKGNVMSGFTFANKLTSAQLDVSEDLKRLQIDGDWVVRINDPLERRMKAMESLLSAITARNLLIEERPVEQDVIVVRGKWTFMPPSAPARSRRPNSVHFYTDRIDEQGGAGGGSGDFGQLMHRLEQIAGKKVVDEVEVLPQGKVLWENSHSADRASQSEAGLAQLLLNLQQQTGLEYLRTKRQVPVWFIRDRGATTQPTAR